MARIIAVFVVICMVVIAASVGVVAFSLLGVGLGEAALLSLIAFLVTLLIQNEALRRRERRRTARRFDEMLAHYAATADEIGNVERRLLHLETRAGPEAGLDQVIAEVEVLGTIVTQLAEQLTDADTRIADLQEHVRRDAPPQIAASPAFVVPPQIVGSPPMPEAPKSEPPKSEPPAAGPTPDATPEPAPADDPAESPDAARRDAESRELLAAVTEALDAGRIELYLQPIVTFPQRHIRYYETLTRLVAEDGTHLDPENVLEIAGTAGPMVRIDRFVLQQASRIVRRLTRRNRAVGLFCTLSGSSLMDQQFFAELKRFVDLNGDLAGRMVFALRQQTVQAMGPIEIETLSELRDLGCRFSLDRVDDLQVDFADLGSRGFRFAKIAASRLLDEDPPGRGDIHVADLAALAARFGIDIVADRVEGEAQVIGLLDFDVKYGQGDLFSPPKPVRADILDSLPARPAGSARPEHRRAVG